MAPPTVFATGVTGYIGGDCLVTLYKAHPDWTYRFLVRDPKRAAPVVEQLPRAELVTGALGDLELLKKESAAANIVLHFASSDDVAAAQALADGVTSRPASDPGYIIHVSGSGSLLFEDTDAGTYGEPRSKIWDDVANIEEIKSLPDHALHRAVDKVMFAAGPPTNSNVRRAIVSPSAIIGDGRGPINKRSIQVPILCGMIKKRGRGFMIGRGLAVWNFVHVQDLTELFVELAEDAARGGSSDEIWGSNGYFFAENGEREWGAVSKCITKYLNKKRPDIMADGDAVDSLGPDDEYIQTFPLSLSLHGANSKSKASRARKMLKWKPTFSDFEMEFENAVNHELETASQSRLDDFAQGHGPSHPGMT